MQGRFKREGNAAAEPERSAGERGPSAQHAPNRPGEAASPQEKPARPAAPTGPGSRLALRNWRISTRLVSLLALPVVAATTLGALRINQSMDNIQQLDNMRLLTDMTRQATELAYALQDERDKSAGPLAQGSRQNDFDITGPRDATDRERQAFFEATKDIQGSGDDENLKGIRQNVTEITKQLSKLSDIRQNAYDDPKNSSGTVEAYSRLIGQLLGLSQDMAQSTSNPDMIQRTRALTAFTAAKEYASVQRAIIAAALPPNDREYGKLSDTDRQYGDAARDNEETELRTFIGIYQDGNPIELLRPLEKGSPNIQASDKYAQRVLSDEEGMRQEEPRSYKDWVDADSAKIEAMHTIELTLLGQMEQQARELRNQSEREAVISGALILLVLGVSLVGAFVVARSMIRSLRRLEDTATRVAQERLPELVKHLSESDPQDVDTSVDSVGVHSRDEIGKVAAAFDDVHREAVRLAAEQALLRGNVNAMFTNLSRRSQGLIQRQLTLISELESREADPDQLSSLFKLDHLATRMRRNGENLLVLAGEEPGRRWTRPVPLVDVLRAAASEVEQYERIELSAVPASEVAGRVVNDLVHLLAELLENATSFSSPQTKVKVTGHALPDGRVLIEIHDTGIGLSPEDLAAINERLASPPTVDVSVSRRMGLFVVGRLSQRHGIRIQLRPSDSGGTTALVMLPVDVAQGKKMPGRPGGGGPAAAQASAGRRTALGQTALGQSGGDQGKAGLLGSSASRPVRVPPRNAAVEGGQRTALPAPSSGPGTGPGAGTGQDSGAGQGRPGPGAPRGAQPALPRRHDASAGDIPGGPTPPARGDSSAPQEGAGRRRRPQLPPPGGPRPELPGGARPVGQGWSAGGRGEEGDRPRSHEEGPSTTRLRHPNASAGPDAGRPAGSDLFSRPQGLDGGRAPQPEEGPFVRPDVFSSRDEGRDRQAPTPNTSAPRQEPAGRGPGPGDTVGFPAVRSGDTGDSAAPRPTESTGSFALPTGGPGRPGDGRPENTGSHPRPGDGRPENTGSFPRPETSGRDERPRPPAQRPGGVLPPSPSAPRAAGTESLPPAGPGDGRTPLYDTLETNWFRDQQRAAAERAAAQEAQGGAPAQHRAGAPAPDGPLAHGAPAGAGGSPEARPGWRTSPNDELGRQAERVRRPSAGGVTVSGLPRRVPRANLVAGTAEQPAAAPPSGPQVSRAPSEVRGRLTNLRRGIQQGRQAGSGESTESFPRPTHPQERQ